MLAHSIIYVFSMCFTRCWITFILLLPSVSCTSSTTQYSLKTNCHYTKLVLLPFTTIIYSPLPQYDTMHNGTVALCSFATSLHPLRIANYLFALSIVNSLFDWRARSPQWRVRWCPLSPSSRCPRPPAARCRFRSCRWFNLLPLRVSGYASLANFVFVSPLCFSTHFPCLSFLCCILHEFPVFVWVSF